jgi:hypothetical protein
MYIHLPSNLTSGDWTVGLVVDSAASAEQASSVEKILSGKAGGPFGELAQFIGTYAGMERANVSVADGKKPSATIEGKSEIQFQPVLGVDGAPTTVKNAMFGFAPEFQVGSSSGHSDAFGITYEPSYGEAAEFMFSTEAAGSNGPRTRSVQDRLFTRVPV